MLRFKLLQQAKAQCEVFVCVLVLCLLQGQENVLLLDDAVDTYD